MRLAMIVVLPVALPVVLAVAFAVAGAQQVAPVAVKEESPGLLKKARITADSARSLALARVPGAQVKAFEIEREKGRLIYSLDLVTAGKSGIDEVAIDAQTGAVIGVQHETPADEAKEAAKDKADAAAKAKAKPGSPAGAKPMR